MFKFLLSSSKKTFMEEKEYEKRRKREGFRRDDVDWFQIIDVLIQKKKVGAIYDFKSNGLVEIFKIGKHKVETFIDEDLGCDPLNKKMVKNEARLLKLYKKVHANIPMFEERRGVQQRKAIWGKK